MSVASPPHVVVRPDRQRAIVAPEGEIDLATTGPVEEEVVALCERGFAEVCLDLRSVTFFDSSGLRMLIRLADRLTTAGCRFTVEAGEGPVARVMEITRLADRFPRPAPALH